MRLKTGLNTVEKEEEEEEEERREKRSSEGSLILDRDQKCDIRRGRMTKPQAVTFPRRCIEEKLALFSSSQSLSPHFDERDECSSKLGRDGGGGGGGGEGRESSWWSGYNQIRSCCCCCSRPRRSTIAT